MRILFFMMGVLFYNNICAMEPDLSIMPSDWAYVILRGCKKCGVQAPVIPQMKMVSLSVKNKSDLDSFFRNPVNKTLYCPHSGLGIYKALSSFDIKKNKKDVEVLDEDNRLYKGLLGQYYVASAKKTKDDPWLNVKKCLFIGNNLLAGNMCHNKMVAQELCNFFLIAEDNAFDTYDIISKRWPEKFIANIYRTSIKDAPPSEGFEVDACSVMKSVLDYNSLLLSFAVSYDGLTSAVSIGQRRNTVLLLRKKKQEVLELVKDNYPIAKMVFSRNNAVLVTVSSGLLNDCSIWDVETGREKATIFCVQDGVSTVAVSDDGRLVALFGGNVKKELKTLSVWDSHSGNCVITIDDSAMPDIVSLEFSADKKWLVGRVVDELDYLLLWKVDLECKRLVPITQYGPFSACAFTVSGNLATFADYEGSIYVLDTHDNTERIIAKEFVGGIVRVLLFDPQVSNILFTSVYVSGAMYSVWNFFDDDRKNFFLIPSLKNASATEFTSMSFNGDATKLLLGSSNAFVFGDWIRGK